MNEFSGNTAFPRITIYSRVDGMDRDDLLKVIKHHIARVGVGEISDVADTRP